MNVKCFNGIIRVYFKDDCHEHEIVRQDQDHGDCHTFSVFKGTRFRCLWVMGYGLGLVLGLEVPDRVRFRGSDRVRFRGSDRVKVGLGFELGFGLELFV